MTCRNIREMAEFIQKKILIAKYFLAGLLLSLIMEPLLARLFIKKGLLHARMM
jgi:hypothetical protein